MSLCACTAEKLLNAGASLADVELLTALHRSSWFSIEGLAGMTSVNQGSAAGTPLADLVYSIAMSRILSVLQLRLHDLQLVHRVDTAGFQELFGYSKTNYGDWDISESGYGLSDLEQVSYVDDVVIPIFAGAVDIFSNLQIVVETAVSVFWRFGLKLNALPGKTAATVAIHGKGAHKAQQQLHVLSAHGLECSSACPYEGPFVMLGIVTNILGVYQNLLKLCLRKSMREWGQCRLR